MGFMVLLALVLAGGAVFAVVTRRRAGVPASVALCRWFTWSRLSLYFSKSLKGTHRRFTEGCPTVVA
jgi:hypothetical protein